MKTLSQLGTFILIAALCTHVSVLSQPSDHACIQVTENEPPAISFAPTDEDGTFVPVTGFMPRLEAYLNGGGSPEELEAALDEAAAQSEDEWLYHVLMTDVTGDDVPEVIVQLTWAGGALDGGIFTYNCEEAGYVGYLMTPLNTWGAGDNVRDGMRYVEDMNGNGIPEVVVSYVRNIGIHFIYDRSFAIYEWNGAGFRSLIQEDEFGEPLATAYRGDGEPRDLDNDDVLELVLRGEPFYHHDFTQWSRLDRGDEMIWSWNGEMYALTCTRAATPPEYRIQAMQDGGDAMLCGDYQAALGFYQQVIDDDALLAWSAADNLCPGCSAEESQLDIYEEMVREMGTPVPDPGERDRLAAYTRYRMVLVYAALGQLEEAEAILDDLRATASAGTVGAEYANLAESFWNAYNESGDLTAACQLVEENAATMQIASPMAHYNFHGSFVGDPYGSEDICPLMVSQ